MRAFRRHRNYNNLGQACTLRFAARTPVQGRIRIHGLSASAIDENEKLQEKNRHQGDHLAPASVEI